MRPLFALVFVLAGSRAFAGPIGAEDPHAASPTGFPGAYLGSVSLSLQADPGYDSLLLDALDMHLRAVGVMTRPQEVAGYLEQSAGGSEGVKGLREALGREPLDAPKAAALLLTDALARPDQFREVLDGLEALKRGVGRQAAALLRGARGVGDKELLATLHGAGDPASVVKPVSRRSEGWYSVLLDGGSTEGRDGVVLDAPVAATPDVGSGRARAADLALPARP